MSYKVTRMIFSNYILITTTVIVLGIQLKFRRKEMRKNV